MFASRNAKATISLADFLLSTGWIFLALLLLTTILRCKHVIVCHVRPFVKRYCKEWDAPYRKRANKGPETLQAFVRLLRSWQRHGVIIFIYDTFPIFSSISEYMYYENVRFREARTSRHDKSISC